MRLGGPVPAPESPELWVAALRARGYTAAYCPVDHTASAEVVQAYARAAAAADVVIAEVGAWCNPLSPDPAARAQALAYCQAQLALAEAIGARCCVNIAGSRGARWDGPHPENFTPETFDLIVETVRAILDAVRPTRTFYTLETMPWMLPDSPQAYHALLRAVDRPGFAAHLDPVNLINSPRRYADTRGLLRKCFALLGPHLKSCHAKDITLAETLTVHLSEVRPGLGGLDYPAFLRELSALDPDTPLMLEHLAEEADYALAAAYVRDQAAAVER